MNLSSCYGVTPSTAQTYGYIDRNYFLVHLTFLRKGGDKNFFFFASVYFYLGHCHLQIYSGQCPRTLHRHWYSRRGISFHIWWGLSGKQCKIDQLHGNRGNFILSHSHTEYSGQTRAIWRLLMTWMLPGALCANACVKLFNRSEVRKWLEFSEAWPLMNTCIST